MLALVVCVRNVGNSIKLSIFPHSVFYHSILKNQCLCVTLIQRNNDTMIGGLSDMAERNLENMTITLTKEEKKALKQAALDNDMSASELIRKWIAEYWEKQEAEK